MDQPERPSGNARFERSEEAAQQPRRWEECINTRAGPTMGERAGASPCMSTGSSEAARHLEGAASGAPLRYTLERPQTHVSSSGSRARHARSVSTTQPSPQLGRLFHSLPRSCRIPRMNSGRPSPGSKLYPRSSPGAGGSSARRLQQEKDRIAAMMLRVAAAAAAMSALVLVLLLSSASAASQLEEAAEEAAATLGRAGAAGRRPAALNAAGKPLLTPMVGAGCRCSGWGGGLWLGRQGCNGWPAAAHRQAACSTHSPPARRLMCLPSFLPGLDKQQAQSALAVAVHPPCLHGRMPIRVSPAVCPIPSPAPRPSPSAGTKCLCTCLPGTLLILPSPAVCPIPSPTPRPSPSAGTRRCSRCRRGRATCSSCCTSVGGRPGTTGPAARPAPTAQVLPPPPPPPPLHADAWCTVLHAPLSSHPWCPVLLFQVDMSVRVPARAKHVPAKNVPLAGGAFLSF